MKKVLIIDDEPDITDILSQFFSKLGYSADMSGSGADALDKIMQNDYSLVLSDFKMPGLSGIEVFEAIKEIDPLLCRNFILMTGMILDSCFETRVTEEKIMVLKKPFNFDDFDSIIKSIEDIQKGPES